MKWGPDHTERQKKDDGCTKAGRWGAVKMTDGYLTAPVLVGEVQSLGRLSPPGQELYIFSSHIV